MSALLTLTSALITARATSLRASGVRHALGNLHARARRQSRSRRGAARRNAPRDVHERHRRRDAE
jgi:hypothetical protein